MDPFKLAYIAGFFDGEGTIHIGTSATGYAVAHLAITQVDRRPLDLCTDIFGCGKVYGPYKPNNGLSKKDKYIWRVGRRSELSVVVNAIRPYVIVKADRIEAALAHLAANPRSLNKHGNCDHPKTNYARSRCRGDR